MPVWRNGRRSGLKQFERAARNRGVDGVKVGEPFRVLGNPWARWQRRAKASNCWQSVETRRLPPKRTTSSEDASHGEGIVQTPNSALL